MQIRGPSPGSEPQSPCLLLRVVLNLSVRLNFCIFSTILIFSPEYPILYRFAGNLSSSYIIPVSS